MKRKTNLTHVLVLAGILVFCSIALCNCSRASMPDSGDLIGCIELVNDTGDSSLDANDNSGVTVALYELAELDTAIVRINQEYPNIGIQINQETEFEHRISNPLLITTTNSEGCFRMKEIRIGNYNLVIMKQGWGYKYIYNVRISEGENNLNVRSDTGCIKANAEYLYPCINLPNVVQTPLRLQTERVYRVESDTIVLSEVIVEPGVKILMDEGCKLEFHSILSCDPEGAFWRITSSDNIYSTTKTNEFAQYDKIGFHAPNSVNIQRMICEYSHNGVIINAEHFHLQESILRHHYSQALVCSAQTTQMDYTLISNNDLKAITAFYDFSLSASIVYGNGDACFLSESSANISNNYFQANHIALRPFYGDVQIANNCFNDNDSAISPSASNPTIRCNNFYCNKRDIELNGYYTHVTLDFCNPSVEDNNFYESGWYVHLKGSNSVYASGTYLYNGVDHDQVYPDNYLLATVLVSHIFDANNPNSDGFPYVVNFLPRRLAPNNGAGILY